MQNVDDIIDELGDLANWEGCETGDLCHVLLDLWEGYSSYASGKFCAALETEILSIYQTLKAQKEQEEYDEAKYNLMKSEIDNSPNTVMISRINDYLELGGLFNPQLMDHEKVRDMLIECRELISNN